MRVVGFFFFPKAFVLHDMVFFRVPSVGGTARPDVEDPGGAPVVEIDR